MSEQNAARVLGYTPELWDADLEGAPATPAAPAAPAAPGWPALAPVAGNGSEAWRSGGKAPQSSALGAPRPTLRDAVRFDSGLIFGCKRDTYDENMTRKMFGLPASNFKQVEKVGERTALFLFNHTTRQLHGVFVCNGAAGMNLEPHAWAHKRGPSDPTDRSPYPAQVRWLPWIRCNPIGENLWSEVPTVRKGKQGQPAQYELCMTAEQAQRLAQLCMRHGAGITK